MTRNTYKSTSSSKSRNPHLSGLCIMVPQKRTKIRRVIGVSLQRRESFDKHGRDPTSILFSANRSGVRHRESISPDKSTTERDYLRFLWVDPQYYADSEIRLITFRFCRVPFRIITSSFILAAIIIFLLKQCPNIQILFLSLIHISEPTRPY